MRDSNLFSQNNDPSYTNQTPEDAYHAYGGAHNDSNVYFQQAEEVSDKVHNEQDSYGHNNIISQQ